MGVNKDGKILSKIARNIPNFAVLILFIIAVRLPLMLFLNYPVDFQYYMDISRDFVEGKRLYMDIRSVHPPFADLTFAFFYFLCPFKENLMLVSFFMKIPLLLSDIFGTYGIYKILILLGERKERAWKMTVLYGLNPFLILQTGSGHFDTYIATSLVFMIFFTIRKNEFRASLISSIGTLFKYVPILAFPNLLMQAKKKLLVLASLFVFVIVSLYFLITEYSRFIWVFTCRVEHAIQGMSAWHFIKIIVSGFKIENIDTIQKSLHSSDHLVLSYGWLFVFIPLFVAYLLFTYQNKEKFTSKDIPSLLCLPVIIFVMCGKVIGPNYLIWIFPLVLITKDERTYKMLVYVGFFFTVVLGITAFKLSQNTSVILSQMPAESVGVFMREVAKVLAAIPMPVWVFFVLTSIVWFYWVMLKFLSENKVAKQYYEALKMLPIHIRNIVFKKLMKARYFGL